MFFDLTKNITLTTKQQRRYVFLRILVLLSALVAVFFFVSALLLPTITFHFKASIDSLANTITRPVHDGEKTSFSVTTAQNVDRAQLTITTLSPLPENTTVTLYKSYGAFLYPMNTAPSEYSDDTSLPFPDGSLIASREGVYVTSGTTKHAFDTEETFLASGYNFDNVIDAPSATRALYKKGKIFSMTSYHPAGTRFYATDTQHTFVVTEDKMLEPQMDTDIKHAIVVQEASRTEGVQCTLVRNTLRRNTYTCTFDLTPIMNFPGKRYYFSTTDITPSDIATIRISLSTAKTSANILSRLAQITSLLGDHYSK